MESRGNIGVEKGKVILADFNNEWSEVFRLEQQYLADVLEINEERIFHIGSTSITDCKAKPIIDIAVSYDRICDSINHQTILSRTEYAANNVYYLPDRICYTKGNPQKYHLYLVQNDSPSFVNWILVKEILSHNKALREKYCQLKEELALRFSNDRVKYTQAKSSFIFSLLKENLLWQEKVLSRRM